MTKKATKPPAALDPALFDAGAESALDSVARAGPQAEVLIDEWLKRSNAAAIAELAERGQGGLRKAARRAINVLKARGVAVPERRRVTSLAGAKPAESFEAWMMAPDAIGALVMVLASRSPTSRYRAAFVVLHDDEGVYRVDVGELSQSGLRDAMEKLLPGAQYKPIKVPIEWARARVAAARKRHAERRTPEPLGFARASALLEPVPAEPPDHPFDSEGLELSQDDAREMAKDSARLHALPEFRGWMPTRPAVDELIAKLGESLKPGEQPAQDRMRELMEEQIRAATDRYFSPQRRQMLVRMLKDSALSVLHREGEVRALEVVAIMRVIENAGLITDPPHEIGFLRAFFEKAMSVLLSQGGGTLRVPVPYQPIEAAPEPDEPAPSAGEPAVAETSSVPATSVPATSVPATSVPATSVPATSVPAVESSAEPAEAPAAEEPNES